jgi:peroxiredoxin
VFNMNKWIRFGLLTVGVVFSLRAFGADLGDKAPSWQIAQWIEGTPSALEDHVGKTVVITFWEANCPYCRDSLPYLTELNSRFANRNVVLVAVTTEPAAMVKGYLTTSGIPIRFAVGADDNRRTYDAYMTAYGAEIIPRSFIVATNGVVLWHGHPKAGLEQALNDVLAGKFDLAEAKKAANAEKMRKEYIALVAAKDAGPRAKDLGERILADGARDPWLMNNFAWEILTAQIQTRDRELALRAAKAACDITSEQNSSFMDTYARALFDSNKIDQAIKVQKRAIEVCKEESHRSALEQTLKTYQEEAGKRPK